MGLLWFLLGAVVGGGATWFFLVRESDLRIAQAEQRIAAELRQAQANANDADMAHRETKERLIALQLEHEAQRRQPPAAGAPPAAPSAAPSPASPVHLAAASTDERDLKRIKGIGPALERRLKDLGIGSLRQLAELSAGEVERLNAKLDFPGRIQRERWIEQARALLDR